MHLKRLHSKFQNAATVVPPVWKRRKGGNGECKIATRLLLFPFVPLQPIPATLTCLPTTGLGQSNMGFTGASHLPRTRAFY